MSVRCFGKQKGPVPVTRRYTFIYCLKMIFLTFLHLVLIPNIFLRINDLNKVMKMWKWSRCGVGSQDAEVFQAHVGHTTVDTGDMEICSTRNQFKYFPKKVMLDAEVVE